MNNMKLNRSVLALMVLFFAYLTIIIISYSTFLQIPVFQNKPLVWQSLVEQFTTWIPMTLAYIFLLKTISANPLKKRPLIKEHKLIPAGIFLLFISAFSVGAHAISQIIEDYLINSSDTTLFSLIFFFDEYIGHIFIFSLTILSFFLVLLELNRKSHQLSISEKTIVIAIGILNGLFWGISGTEGGSTYVFTIPLAVTLLFYLYKLTVKHKLKITTYPFSFHFLVSSVIMTTFTIYWIIGNGWFSQPSDYGIELFNF